MSLKDITREAVVAAIAEYEQIGQEAFLGRYGFDRARQYVLVQDGRTYDSKAIVGAAHGYLPGESPLAAGQFSGGEATVGRLLRRLGFTVQVGEELTSDQLKRLLARLQVYRSEGLPALYQPITLLWAFGRAHRGEQRLLSWSETKQQVAALFRLYGRGTEGDRVYYPVAALYSAGLWELNANPERVPAAHGSSVPQRWFDEHHPASGLVSPVYDLIRESPQALAAAVGVLTRTYFVEADPGALLSRLGLSEPAVMSPLEMSLQERAAEYQRRCVRADLFWQGQNSRRAARTSAVPVRSDDARLAVLIRSGGHCENPRCAGDIRDVTDAGAPILEIDHIQDLALGGVDDPAQMIALCPNCHSIKTRGRTRDQLRLVLSVTARTRHNQLTSASPENRPAKA